MHVTLSGIWYVPGGQAVQLDEPPVETLPSLHGMQKAAPLYENVDAGHGLHSLAHAPA